MLPITNSSAGDSSPGDRAILFVGDDRPIVRLTGRDHLRYLHGRVTQDIKGLPLGSMARSLVLTPQGRIQGQMQLLRTEKDILVIGDPVPVTISETAADSTPVVETEQALLAALFQFRVADDIQSESLSQTHLVLHLVGERWASILNSAGVQTLPTTVNTFIEIPAGADSLFKSGATLIATKWADIPAYDVVLEKHSLFAVLDRLSSDHGVTVGDDAMLTELRIAARRPVMGVDLTEDTLAPDIPLDELVSFRKGCYAGQEVVEMATARGRPNKKLVRLIGSSPIDLPVREPLRLESSPDGDSSSAESSPGKSVGMLTSQVRIGDVIHALGFVRISVADDAKLLASGCSLQIVP